MPEEKDELKALRDEVEFLKQRVGGFEKRTRWRPYLTYYRASELCGIRFSSSNDLLAALQLLRGDDLRDCPYDVADELVMILPRDVIPYLKGISFSVEDVCDPDDLSPEEYKKFRERRGHH